jgi:hypothetical protein
MERKKHKDLQSLDTERQLKQQGSHVARQTASKCRGLDSRENQGLTVDGNHTSRPGSAGPQVAVLPPAPTSAGGARQPESTQLPKDFQL